MTGPPERLDDILRAACVPRTARRGLQNLRDSSPAAAEALAGGSFDFLVRLGDLVSVSTPMLEVLRSHPEWLRTLETRTAESPADLQESLQDFFLKAPPGSDFPGVLQDFQRRAVLEIALRDVAGLAPFEETVQRLSRLADVVIDAALRHCRDSLGEKIPGSLRDAGPATGFAVFALGKLGAGELNYSSDIDLIFCRRLSDADPEVRFFTRLGERLVRMLSAQGKGIVLYRVDMRLRPYGSTGPLVPTIDSLVNYYESWAEAWERQALIKMRPVAGDPELARRFRAFAGRYAFARQMDDSSLEEIKRVKHRAEREYSLPAGKIHLKQGPGGIRDIEFYVQYLQLISGSRLPEAREPSTLKAIRGLGSAKVLLEGEESALSLAYLFLRTVEHRLQLRSLTPAQVLPETESELEPLARCLGFGRRDEAVREFRTVLEGYRRRVRNILERIYLTPGALRPREREEEFARLLSERTPVDRVRELLAPYGFADIDKAWQNIRLMALGPAGRMLPPGERRAFLEVVFPLLEVLGDSYDPDQALHNLESFATATGNRVSFMRSLASRRPHLMRLANLLALSNYSHRILTRHPEYFDSLARGIHLHEGRRRKEMLEELRERLRTAPEGTAGENLLRRFRQREMVRIAYRDLGQLAGPVEISTELSSLAEASLEAAVGMVEDRILEPGTGSAPMTVLGLGKLGSRQMHYSSDLDLVFLYEGSGRSGAAGRAGLQRSMDAQAEKLLEVLAGVTAEGIAYRIDLRLRPEGSSGLLARTWASFEEYGRRFMQPWERMALVRSRVLGEDSSASRRWEELLSLVVYEFTWDDDAVEAVRHIKRRIENEKNRESRASVDFKYGSGGIADLEFLVQMLQVQYGREHRGARAPEISRALPALQEAGALSGSECEDLLTAHRFQRHVENHYQLIDEWGAREVSRESPLLDRLARSLGYPDRRGFLRDWDETAQTVRGLFKRYF